MTDRITGQRFSSIYIAKGDPQTDSDEMRFRLGKLLSRDVYQSSRRNTGYIKSTGRSSDPETLKTWVEDNLGIPFWTDGQSNWVLFIRKIPLLKLLDTITIAYKKIATVGSHENFIQQVNAIFREENIAYEVDDEGGVHPTIDVAFTASKQATIRGMSASRYTLSRERIEQVDAFLLSEQPDYISAIRNVFSANENIFKLMYKTPRLDKKSAEERIGGQVQSLYEGSPAMLRASLQVIQSFGRWIDAAHHYRHEEGVEESNQPAEELALVMISEGIAFVRWLVAIDRKVNNT